MNEIFTINMLKTASKCLKKYDFLYNQKIRLPEHNTSVNTGSRIHALINYYFKNQNVEKLLSTLDSSEMTLWANFLDLKLKKPLESEFSFLVRFEDVWLSGRMDALFFENGKITIADWKTGNFNHNEDEMFQTMFYLYAASVIFMKNGMVRDFSEISMVYYLLKDKKEIKIDFSSDLFADFENKFKKILEKIKYGRYNSGSHIHCEACEYRNICDRNLL